MPDTKLSLQSRK